MCPFCSHTLDILWSWTITTIVSAHLLGSTGTVPVPPETCAGGNQQQTSKESGTQNFSSFTDVIHALGEQNVLYVL